MEQVRPGISVLLDDRRELLRHRRVGILTGPSGVLPDVTRSVDELLRVSDLRAIFTPEHGLLGAAAEGTKIGDSVYRAGRRASGILARHPGLRPRRRLGSGGRRQSPPLPLRQPPA